MEEPANIFTSQGLLQAFKTFFNLSKFIVIAITLKNKMKCIFTQESWGRMYRMS